MFGSRTARPCVYGWREGCRVSVSELPRERPGAEFERTPPQDIVAEQSVLGGMLLS